ncbi:MAG: TraR/DksA C4-type zinc finger protein [Candidatus Moranbacteria bacterium]|nr:TraR/DksA C4-type zinc finger protein [Candidatus Moranbacteria bacterium]
MIDSKTREELKQKLLEEKKRIEENISKTEISKKGTDREYETAFPEIERDQEENADEMEMYESNLAIDESMKLELEKIDEALSRMEKGTYGICSNCQKEIPLERLRAYPQADTCLDCQK